MSEVTNEDSMQNTKTAASEQTPKANRFKLWQKVVVGVVGFIVVIFAIAFFATSGASKASDDFVNAILRNDATTAYSLFTSDAQKTISHDDFKAIVSNMSGILDDSASQKSKNVEGETGESAKGIVTYEIKGSDGTYEMLVNLTKENGQWKVLNFDNKMKR